MVNVAVNNIPIPLLLDLGGYDTVALSKEDSKKAQSERVDSTKKFSSFDGKMQNSAGLRFKFITVGGAVFSDIEGSELDGDEASYIGAGFLGKWLIVFDYPGKEVRLYQSGDMYALEHECGTTAFPVDVKHGVFQTYLKSEGKLLTAAFDTGANYSVLRPSVLNLKTAPYVPGSSPSIHSLRKIRINDAKIKELSAVLIEFRGPPVDIILGANFFQGRRICLDGNAHIGAIR